MEVQETPSGPTLGQPHSEAPSSPRPSSQGPSLDTPQHLSPGPKVGRGTGHLILKHTGPAGLLTASSPLCNEQRGSSWLPLTASKKHLPLGCCTPVQGLNLGCILAHMQKCICRLLICYITIAPAKSILLIRISGPLASPSHAWAQSECMMSAWTELWRTTGGEDVRG